MIARVRRLRSGVFQIVSSLAHLPLCTEFVWDVGVAAEPVTSVVGRIQAVLNDALSELFFTYLVDIILVSFLQSSIHTFRSSTRI